MIIPEYLKFHETHKLYKHSSVRAILDIDLFQGLVSIIMIYRHVKYFLILLHQIC